MERGGREGGKERREGVWEEGRSRRKQCQRRDDPVITGGIMITYHKLSFFSCRIF